MKDASVPKFYCDVLVKEWQRYYALRPLAQLSPGPDLSSAIILHKSSIPTPFSAHSLKWDPARSYIIYLLLPGAEIVAQQISTTDDDSARLLSGGFPRQISPPGDLIGCGGIRDLSGENVRPDNCATF